MIPPQIEKYLERHYNAELSLEPWQNRYRLLMGSAMEQWIYVEGGVEPMLTPPEAYAFLNSLHEKWKKATKALEEISSSRHGSLHCDLVEIAKEGLRYDS